MTESEWLLCQNPWPMLERLANELSSGAATYHLSNRKAELYILASHRAVWSQLCEEDRSMIEEAEQFVEEVVVSNSHLGRVRAIQAEVDTDVANYTPTLCVQACLVRELFGNPYRPVTVPRERVPCPECSRWEGKGYHGDGPVEGLSSAERARRACSMCNPRDSRTASERGWIKGSCCWLTKDVRDLIRHACAKRQPDGTLDPLVLAVLADALEEAGAEDEQVLSHLREPGPHFRGCWCLDLLLEKD